MAHKKVGVSLVLAFSAGLLLAGSAQVQMDSIYRFRGVKIPVNLMIKGTVMESGPFDLEFLVARESGSLCLRLIRKGKVVGYVPGQEWTYKGRDPVPAKPTLRMGRDTGTGTLILTFESGRSHAFYPMVRAEYSIPYIQAP